MALGLVACGNGPSGSGVEAGEAAAPAQSDPEELRQNALSRTQQKQALQLIDDICGDAWCDGDYDFGFRLISCVNSGHTCTLTLQVFPRLGVPSRGKSYWRSCKTSGFSGFASLVNTNASGYQSLNDAYYDALGECLASIELNLS